jgi:two-component system, cell cycle sensor histidine kinase and response regulator CckA
MINFISGFDLVCILAALFSFIMLYKGWKRGFSEGPAFLFASMLVVTLIRAVGDFAQWSGISVSFNRYEEYSEILEPMLWGFLFYAVLQMLTEKTLRESEENLAVTLDSIGEGVIVTTTEGIIVRMNPQAELIIGTDQAHCVGKNIDDAASIIDAITKVKRTGLIQSVIAKGKISGFAKKGLLVRADNTERIITDSSAPIYDRSHNVIGVVVVFKDITEQYLVEEELRHAEKMRAIGQLAGGIAHDFNNLCTGINNYSELLDLCVINDNKAKKYITQIKNCTNQAADLTRMLLAFARKGKLEERPVDIHNVISETVGILQHTISVAITIECELHAQYAIVLGDYSQIENAILNLALNARDAMENGGVLTFVTAQVDLDEEYCRKHGLDLSPGEYIEIAVSDTGIGMSDEVQKHLFEPFFTTKELSKGTGLGLASVYGTIKNHHGAIDVVSKLHEGTTVIIFLPILSQTKNEGV